MRQRGRLGGSSQMCGWKDAGVTFRETKAERQKRLALRKMIRSLDGVRKAQRRAFDATPRLVKP